MVKRNCYYWTWGGGLDKGFDKGFPIYPAEYGAKCMFFKESFLLGLNCERCREFIDNEKMKKLLLGGKAKRTAAERFFQKRRGRIL